MAALPGSEWSDAPMESPALARVTHVFSHFRLELAIASASEPEGDGWWQSLDNLEEAGLPTLYRRAVEAALQTRSKLAA